MQVIHWYGLYVAVYSKYVYCFANNDSGDDDDDNDDERQDGILNTPITAMAKCFQLQTNERHSTTHLC